MAFVSPPDRVQAIQDFPTPKNTKAERHFIGMMNWFRIFIPNFSVVVLLQNFFWNTEQRFVFHELKRLLAHSDVLAFPRYDIPFYVAVDTSFKDIGYMLYQKHHRESNSVSDDNIKVVRFGSKYMSKWQHSCGPTKLELLGMVSSILDCTVY